MKGELVLFNELDDIEDMCNISVSICDFGLSLYVDEENTLELQLLKKDELLFTIDNYIDYLTSESNIDDMKIYENLKQNIDHLIDNIEFVRLDLNDVDIIDFIDNNPIIQSKKIVLSEFLEINDYDKAKKLLTIYDKYKDNIYVSMANNMGYVSLINCFNTINKIKEQADRILALNLSPMETIMYTYDQVRNRVYKNESENDSPSKSRDLSSVLSSEEIVCVGYSNIFQALLHYMNIRCLNIGLTHKEDEIEAGHRRNIIYVQDQKYDIDGIYYFDVTWDSKRKDETNEFLNRYIFFAKTRKQMIEMEKDCYIYDQCPYYSDDMVSDIKSILDEEKLFELNCQYAKSLNYIGDLIDGEKLIDRNCLLPFLPIYNKFDREELLRRLCNIESKLNKPISAEIFIKLLNNVRKIQYYENPEFYPYTIDNLYETYIRSHWKFDKHHYDFRERLLLAIMGSEEVDFDTNRNAKSEDFVNFTTEENIYKNMKEVQLTKVLQKVYEKRI